MGKRADEPGSDTGEFGRVKASLAYDRGSGKRSLYVVFNSKRDSGRCCRGNAYLDLPVGLVYN